MYCYLLCLVLSLVQCVCLRVAIDGHEYPWCYTTPHDPICYRMPCDAIAIALLLLCACCCAMQLYCPQYTRHYRHTECYCLWLTYYLLLHVLLIPKHHAHRTCRCYYTWPHMLCAQCYNRCRDITMRSYCHTLLLMVTITTSAPCITSEYSCYMI